MKPHILIVEDELKLAQLMKDFLLQSDYQVTMLHQGDKVLPWLEEHSTDLICWI